MTVLKQLEWKNVYLKFLDSTKNIQIEGVSIFVAQFFMQSARTSS
ncbi:hypothetical protein J500_0770 [Acinetobacter sp. 479375]|jgi:hypothetical protein|nr:hypothetical protein J500_0770 [Acinetobacter sp. 479375]